MRKMKEKKKRVKRGKSIKIYAPTSECHVLLMRVRDYGFAAFHASTVTLSTPNGTKKKPAERRQTERKEERKRKKKLNFLKVYL